jgi:hypothetical protein
MAQPAYAPAPQHPAGWHPMHVLALAATLVAAALIAAGLVLGFGSVHKLGVNCGSALGGATDNATVQEYTVALEGGPATSIYSEQCASGLSDRKTLAWALLAPGLVLLFVAGGLEWAARRR